MIPTIIPKSSHSLELTSFDPDALKVIEKLRAAGHKAYLVGGCVRDLLLNKQPKDFDISTSAKPEEIKRLFRNCILIGKRFRLAHLRFGRQKILEVSTFRSGDTENEALITRDNLWGSEEEDVLRRDFTINGLFYDSENETILDYVGGYKDLKDHTLKTIGQPFIRFKQDPVRMIRCIKFQARFDFEVEEETKLALIECRKEIVKSSQARILEELLRMLESCAAKKFFELMTQCGLLEMLLPALSLFLEHKSAPSIYILLNQVDELVKHPPKERLSRSFLLCSIVFPLLDHHIQTHVEKETGGLHIGLIQNECNFILDQLFRPFFFLPKKMKAKMNAILTTQYRLTPLDKKKNKIKRIPRIEEFPLALDFLKFRTHLDPSLNEPYESWVKLHELSPSEEKPRRRRAPRKRTRKKDSKPSTSSE